MRARMKDNFQNLLLAFISCVVGLVFIGVCMNALQVDFTIAAIIIAVLVLAAIAILPNLWKAAMRRYSSRDEKTTVMPIIHTYQDTHDLKALMTNYRNWVDGSHTRDLRIRFSRVITSILIDRRRFKEARNELAYMERLAAGHIQRSEYEEFREGCERRMRQDKNAPKRRK